MMKVDKDQMVDFHKKNMPVDTIATVFGIEVDVVKRVLSRAKELDALHGSSGVTSSNVDRVVSNIIKEPTLDKSDVDKSPLDKSLIGRPKKTLPENIAELSRTHTHDELAKMFGCSVKTVSRAIKKANEQR